MRHAEFLAEQYRGKRVALIGGSGQVGSYLAPMLILNGAEVEIYDRVPATAGSQHHIYNLIDNASQVKRNIEWWKPHYVFNLAAKVSGVTYNERSHFDMGLQNVLLQSLPLWICENIETRFVQFSTVCVLPHDAPVPTTEIPINELDLPEPSNLGYGLAKQFGEWLCRFAQMEKPNLSILCLRPSNLYGREQPNDPFGHVIPRFTWRLLNHEDPMIIRGLPTTERSFLHAHDCAYAAALLAPTDGEGTINVPASGSVSMAELLGKLIAIIGWSPNKIEWGTAAHQGYAKREADRRLFDATLLQNGISPWTPSIDLDRGLREYVDWCLLAKSHLFQQVSS